MIMCNTMVTGAFEDTSASMLLTAENIDTFHKICEIAHSNDCKVCPQLMPGCGRVGGPAPQYGVPVSASACDWMHAPGVPCHDLPVEYGFQGIEEGIEIGRRLEAAGVDVLHVDAGCYEKWHYAMPPVYFQEMTPQIAIAKAVREAVSIPVITHGRLGDVEKAEAALRQGSCDFVAIARGVLADPELPNKVMCGNTEDIRPCISCNDGCIGQVFAGQPAGCAINPICGHERIRTISQAQKKKKVLVIGAGPGGCAAALMAAQGSRWKDNRTGRKAIRRNLPSYFNRRQ